MLTFVRYLIVCVRHHPSALHPPNVFLWSTGWFLFYWWPNWGLVRRLRSKAFSFSINERIISSSENWSGSKIGLVTESNVNVFFLYCDVTAPLLVEQALRASFPRHGVEFMLISHSAGVISILTFLKMWLATVELSTVVFLYMWHLGNKQLWTI